MIIVTDSPFTVTIYSTMAWLVSMVAVYGLPNVSHALGYFLNQIDNRKNVGAWLMARANSSQTIYSYDNFVS